MARLIGITGFAGAGKDSVARHLIEKFGYRKEFFARRLKELCCQLYGWSLEKLDDLAYKESPQGEKPGPLLYSSAMLIAEREFGATGYDEVPRRYVVDHIHHVINQPTADWTRRRVLQYVGTEGFRALDPDHWVKRAMADVGPGELVVFTDVRFPNEADAIRAAGGIIVGIQKLDRDAPLLDYSALHGSEAGVPRLIAGADASFGVPKGRMDMIEKIANFIAKEF